MESIRAVLKNNRMNKKGVTLVEVMIALVVLLFVFMGLLQAALLSIESNTKNLLRDEMTRLVAERTAEIKNISFDNVGSDLAGDLTLNITACTLPPVSDAGLYVPLTLRVRNMTLDNCGPGKNLNCCGSRVTVTDLEVPPNPVDTKQITILLRCEFKGDCISQTLPTSRRR